MAENTNAPRVLQRQNPNPPEKAHSDVIPELPSVETLLGQVMENEFPRSKESREFINIQADEIGKIIKDSLVSAQEIEEAARNPNRWDIPKEIIDSAALIVDFSAPGTYYQPKKDDKYKEFNWSWNMDRERADTSACLGIHLAGLATNNDFSEFTRHTLLDGLDQQLNSKRESAKKAIIEKGLHFLYLGTRQESEAIRKVIHTPNSFIPPQQVEVIDKGIDNTVEQVLALKSYLDSYLKTDKNPAGFILPDSSIIIPMGLQAIRAFPILEKFKAIPEGIKVVLFPIATPLSGMREYVSLETKGRVYYTLTGKGARQPIPYTLLGKAA